MPDALEVSLPRVSAVRLDRAIKSKKLSPLTPFPLIAHL